MMNRKLSVIIPTYNRKTILVKTVKELLHQSIGFDYEIIIVDDGSTDGTFDFIQNGLIKEAPNIFVYQQPNQGPGAARNNGIIKSRGEYILFLGDDIIPSYRLLEEHLKFHQQNENVAVLGFTDWAPELKITKFMKCLAPYGQQFNYTLAEKKRVNLPFSFFYTSNISLHRKWLEDDKFDLDFKRYGCEDQELGYRLTKKGLNIIFNKEAIAYHHHILKEEDVKERMERAGKELYLFYKKHPDILGTPYLRQYPQVIAIATQVLYKLKLGRLFGSRFYYKAMACYHLYKGFLECYYDDRR